MRMFSSGTMISKGQMDAILRQKAQEEAESKLPTGVPFGYAMRSGESLREWKERTGYEDPGFGNVDPETGY